MVWYVGVNLILLIVSGLLGVDAFEFIPQLVSELIDMIRRVWDETIGSIFCRVYDKEVTTVSIDVLRKLIL